MGTGKWLQHVQRSLSKGLESTIFPELDCKSENSFWVFMKNLQSEYVLSAAFSCLSGLGFLVHMYVKHSRSKTSPWIHWIYDLKIWFSIMYFQYFFIENPCQSWKIFPFWMWNDLPACPSMICCTKRFERHYLIFSHS